MVPMLLERDSLRNSFFINGVLFLMFGFFSQAPAYASILGVGESKFKSLLPSNYKHSLEDPVEEEAPLEPSLEQSDSLPPLNESPPVDLPLNGEDQIPANDQSELPINPDSSAEETLPQQEELPLEPENASELAGSDPLIPEEEENLGVTETLTSQEEETPSLSEDQQEGEDPLLSQGGENKTLLENTPSADGEGSLEAEIEKGEGLDLPEEGEMPVENDTSSLEVPSPPQEVPTEERRFDFGMASFGLEGGIGIASHDYRSSLGNGIDSHYSGYQGILGLRGTWEKLLQDNWTAGVTAALRYYWGNIDTHHQTFTATGQTYKAETTQRYELSGKVGKWIGGVHPYLKIGPVLSNISIQTTDLNSSFTSSTRQWVWGGTVGGGLDAEVSKGILLGGSVEYDRYLMIKNMIFDINNAGATYKATPSFVNVMLTLTLKLDRFI